MSIKVRGDFNNTEKFLKGAEKLTPIGVLNKYGEAGTIALAASTPKDTGKTAVSWDYDIEKTKKGYKLYWTNSNTPNDVPIAILLQYGHGTNGGGYVKGRDYINPALRSIFTELADKIWKEVRRL